MVSVIVKFKAKSDQVEALKTFLSGIQPGVIAAGGKSITLLQDQNDPTTCFEIEEWNAASDHQNFIKGAAEAGAFKPFDSLLDAPFEVYYSDTVKKTMA